MIAADVRTAAAAAIQDRIWNLAGRMAKDLQVGGLQISLADQLTTLGQRSNSVADELGQIRAAVSAIHGPQSAGARQSMEGIDYVSPVVQKLMTAVASMDEAVRGSYVLGDAPTAGILKQQLTEALEHAHRLAGGGSSLPEAQAATLGRAVGKLEGFEAEARRVADVMARSTREVLPLPNGGSATISRLPAA